MVIALATTPMLKVWFGAVVIATVIALPPVPRVTAVKTRFAFLPRKIGPVSAPVLRAVRNTAARSWFSMNSENGSEPSTSNAAATTWVVIGSTTGAVRNSCALIAFSPLVVESDLGPDVSADQGLDDLRHDHHVVR